jgi:hypothetical protein
METKASLVLNQTSLKSFVKMKYFFLSFQNPKNQSQDRVGDSIKNKKKGLKVPFEIKNKTLNPKPNTN